MPDTLQTVLVGDQSMVDFGSRLGEACRGRGIVYLEGELGAGKTTLCRGVLRSYGYQGAVKSPTYTLVEPYCVADRQIYHFDLYRLSSPEELDFLGLSSYFGTDTLCLVEWPSRGEGYLPVADLEVTIAYHNEGRLVRLMARNHHGQAVCRMLAEQTGETQP